MTIEGKRIGVVIPAYNEAGLIGHVVATIPEYVDEIIVVDDGSTDQTAQIAEAVPTINGQRLSLIRHGVNHGVGAALQSGYARALEKGVDVVAVMAGDGQMDPADLRRVLSPVITGGCDYAKGNRLGGGTKPANMPLSRYLAMGPLAMLTRVASGLKGIGDPQSGYTAISRDCLEDIPLHVLHPGYGYPNHLLILLGTAGKRVMDVPVKPVYGQGEVSGLVPWKVAPRLLALLARGYVFRLRAQRLGA